MDQEQNFFQYNDLLEILDDTFDSCNSKREEMYRQIALIHLLVGYPNKYSIATADNIKINKFIIDYLPRIEKFKKKYHL